MARTGTLSALALTLALARSAAAQQAPPPPPSPKVPARAATFAWDKTLLRLTVAYRDVVDDEVRRKLASGLPTVIVMRGYVFEDGAAEPVALTAKTCRVTFDLWEEVFRVQIQQPGADEQTLPAVVAVEGVLRRCAEAQSLAVADYARLKPGGRYLVQAIVEVNPISREMLDRIKRWVSRPAGATGIGAGDALFGSFVGLFVARIGTADRVLTFKTPVVTVPANLPANNP